MDFNTQELVNFTTSDLKIIRDQLDLVLVGRKRIALASFRDSNPVLGMACHDGEQYMGYYEVGGRIPQFAINKINRDVESSWEIVRIHNPDLQELLLESNNSRDKPMVFFDADKNTRDGETWVDGDLDI